MDGSLVPKDVQLPAERMQTSRGIGNISEEDRIIPRLKLMQPLSPEVDEGIAKSGEFVNSTAKKTYGNTLILTPVIWWKSRINWVPRENGGGIVCQARDAVNGSMYGSCADCDSSKWHDKEAPVCTAIINILGLVNNTDLVAVSFMNTGYKTGKQLINLFNYKQVDIFNFSYELSAVQEQNDFGKFWVIKFKDLNMPTNENVYKTCEKIYDNFAKIKEKVEEIHPVE
jgi:hypothetical protein